jgi:hypothetical protein
MSFFVQLLAEYFLQFELGLFSTLKNKAKQNKQTNERTNKL